MKLERLSENQIRCTLYKSDLADKELHLTELAYWNRQSQRTVPGTDATGIQ